MATYSKKLVANETLAANVVDQVAITTIGHTLTVSNVTGTSAIYVVLWWGGAPVPADPTVAGDDCYVLPAAICSRSWNLPTGDAPSVKLISAGAMAYSVDVQQ